jgi:hypothetical protein
MLKHRRRRRQWYIVLVLYCVVIAFQERLAQSYSAAAGTDLAEGLVRKLTALAGARPLDPAAGDDELRKLQKARYNSAIRCLRHGLQNYSAGCLRLDELLEPLQHVRDSSLDLSNDPAQSIAMLEHYSELAQWVESSVEAMVEVGRRTDSDLEHARYVRLGAEIQLLRAKRKLKECERKGADEAKSARRQECRTHGLCSSSGQRMKLRRRADLSQPAFGRCGRSGASVLPYTLLARGSLSGLAPFVAPC